MRSTSYRSYSFAILLVGAFVSPINHAGDVPVLKEFKDTQPAVAAEVNGNFSKLKDAVNQNNARLGTVEGASAAQDTRIEALQMATNAFIPLNTTSAARADCKAILNANESKGSGLYYIHPGPPPPAASTTYLAHCDMKTQGGGWTLVMNVHPSDGSSVSFTNTKFWTEPKEYGEIGAHFSNDYKSPAAWELVGTNIMVEIAKPGINGGIIGHKAWEMQVSGDYNSFFTQPQNTLLTKKVIDGSDVTYVHANEPIIKNGNNLLANRYMNPNITFGADRVRLGADGYATVDDNQPGLGTEMNESSTCPEGNCYRYRDVELWMDAPGNRWCSRPTATTYAWIGNDGGCGDGCAANNCNLFQRAYSELWTYRIYIR